MGRKQSPTDQLHAKQPAERLDRESWLQSVRLQVVNQPVCYVEEFLTGMMPGQLFLLLVSDNVTRVAPCFPDRRILIGEVMIARCLMAD